MVFNVPSGVTTTPKFREPDTMVNTTDNVRETLNDHREELEALADSDLPVNWIAEELIEVADE